MTTDRRRPAPTGFLWGAAISAHQTEGNNINSDCWLLENLTPTVFRQPSLDACDSYHRYVEDFDLAAGFGFNCHRIGLEWARIEPEEGIFSNAAIDHYRRMLEALAARGLRAIVTLNHFTVPRWFAMRGGFEAADSADLFARFCDHVAHRLGDLIDFVLPFNEANIQRLLGLFSGIFSRPAETAAMLAAARAATGATQFSSLIFAERERCEPHMLRAQGEAMAAIKSRRAAISVGLSLTMQDVQGLGDNHAAERVIEALYGPWLEAGRDADFIGVQTYTRILVDKNGIVLPPPESERTGAGYEFAPAALRGTIRLAHERTGRPIMVTESGVCTDDDTRRIAYIDAAIDAVRDCMEDGIDVRSYICWSLLDNFEWTRGYGERFGLVHVDYDSFARTPKPSAHHLGAIARTNLL